MDRGTWRATVHRVAKSQTWLKLFSMHTPRDHIHLFAITNVNYILSSDLFLTYLASYETVRKT